ncbi:MAG: metal-sensitive transcriptional regulator [Ignavibacteriales bacterium]|nr:metal-sensitive transcriptional regulator [Ignavibacteriales bacterium]
MLNQHEKKAVLKRLHTIQGQLDGIEKMIDEDRSVQEIFNQLKAVEKGVHSTIYDVLEDQLKMHLAEVLSVRLAACPGNCSDAERLQYTKKQFAELDLKGVIQSLSWLAPKESERETLKRS